MFEPLKAQGLFAAMLIADLTGSEPFYTRVPGRGLNDRSMPGQMQWHVFGMPVGIQIFEGSVTTGGSRMTLAVPDQHPEREQFAGRGLVVGEISQGTYGHRPGGLLSARS
jgi:hypothetical protein